MFHMLGGFVFISSFSRRSRPGFRMGSTRFGCCCCDRGLLNVFTISIPSIHYSQFKAAASPSPSSIQPLPIRYLAMVLGTHIGPPLASIGALSALLSRHV